jgi:O-antigen ligase
MVMFPRETGKTQRFFEKTGFVLYVLFAFSFFVSKAAVNIAGSLLLLLALIYLVAYKKYDVFTGQRFMAALLAPLLVGFVMSFFSLSGMSGPLAFLSRYRFFLMVVPFAMFIREKKQLDTLFVVLNVSGCIGAAYGFVYGWMTQAPHYFSGFHHIGRNSDLLASICLLDIVILFEYVTQNIRSNYLIRAGLLLATTLILGAVIAIGERGAWVGFYMGLVVYATVFNWRMLIPALALTVLAIVMVYSEPLIMERFRSIKDLEKSNQTRIQIYLTGIDYIIDSHLVVGTGAKNTEKDFKDFMARQPEDYQKKYPLVNTIPGNFHNSFLQMAAEGGGVFLLSYLAGLIYLIYQMWKNLKPRGHSMRVYSLSAIIVTIGACVTYSFHGELYRYGGLVYHLVLVAGCCFGIPGSRKKDSVQDEQESPLEGAAGPMFFSNNFAYLRNT